MKKYYVYELINSLGIIEYVGETFNPNRRKKEHTKKRKHLTMNIVAEFDNRPDALNYQYELQIQYGFESDKQKWVKKCIENAEKRSIAINVYEYKTNKFISKIKSITEASRILNTKPSMIIRVLTGERNKHKGYTFKYNTTQF